MIAGSAHSQRPSRRPITLSVPRTCGLREEDFRILQSSQTSTIQRTVRIEKLSQTLDVCPSKKGPHKNPKSAWSPRMPPKRSSTHRQRVWQRACASEFPVHGHGVPKTRYRKAPIPGSSRCYQRLPAAPDPDQLPAQRGLSFRFPGSSKAMRRYCLPFGNIILDSTVRNQETTQNKEAMDFSCFSLVFYLFFSLRSFAKKKKGKRA